MKRGMALTALAGLGGLSAATLGGVPAAAAPIAGCGEAPDGGNLQRIGDICQLEFSEAGTYQWAVPDDLTDLYAVVVGAGGGALFTEFGEGDSFYGYAGSGGDVRYLDMADAIGNDEVEVGIGSGGATGDIPSTGSASVISYGGTDYPAFGGSGGAFSGELCDLSLSELSYIPYANNGDGAGADAVSGGQCDAGYGLGIFAGTNLDSDDEEPFDIFSGYVTELGGGGRVLPAVEGPGGAPGQGANVYYAAEELTADSDGYDGLVVFRFTATAPADDGADGEPGGGEPGGENPGGEPGGENPGGEPGGENPGGEPGGENPGGVGGVVDGTPPTTGPTTPTTPTTPAAPATASAAQRLPMMGAETAAIGGLSAVLTALGLGAVLFSRRRTVDAETRDAN